MMADDEPELTGPEPGGNSSGDYELQQPPQYNSLEDRSARHEEDIVQVVYQSNQDGYLVGVESALLTGLGPASNPSPLTDYARQQSFASEPMQGSVLACGEASGGVSMALSGGQLNLAGPQTRSTSSTLPSVAEESTTTTTTTSGSGGVGAGGTYEESRPCSGGGDGADCDEEDAELAALSEVPIGLSEDATASALNANEDPTNTSGCSSNLNDVFVDNNFGFENQADNSNLQHYYNANSIYTTINKHNKSKVLGQPQNSEFDLQDCSTNSQVENYSNNNSNTTTSTSFHTAYSVVNQLNQANDNSDSSTLQTNNNKHSPIRELQEELVSESAGETNVEDLLSIDELNTGRELGPGAGELATSGEQEVDENREQAKESGDSEEDFSKLLSRSKGGAAESGSFRQHHLSGQRGPRRKPLGASASVSNNENDLIVHRKKLFELQQKSEPISATNLDQQQQQLGRHELQLRQQEEESLTDLPQSGKFKRTHSVSFNVNSARSSRHSVDIRNLPSYLTVKRASIVDVAKGAMSSLISSFGGGPNFKDGSSLGSRRDSSSPITQFLEDQEDVEPIFEEPIAPTLSLGQRVALVKNSGSEFGTVGWIGQLPEVDDDWVVGVVFDNMIGDCDGEHNGVRYFYARQNYAMFVPLSSLTKTDNYIGRPETGTMLSRMSVSLKPGQLISIHRSSIRLQHCFLNAPHQRVGHDVRAVSNKLHCQCYNCGPCAHLTKQGRLANLSALGAATHHAPLFGTHHVPNKKNSLAHAAVEILAHHHHHYHEEEHEEEEYQFGDNAAHACNFVRYSCCQQSGAPGHEFSADCEMVRPDILDNLIHAPKAPIRKSCLRRKQVKLQQKQKLLMEQQLQIGPDGAGQQQGTLVQSIEQGLQNNDTLEANSDGSLRPPFVQSFEGESNEFAEDQTASSSNSSNSSSRLSSRSQSPQHDQSQSHHYQHRPYDDERPNSGYQLDQTTSYNYYPANSGFATYSLIDNQMSILDQQKFIYRRESSLYNSEYQSQRGLGTSLKRCFACLIGRKKSSEKMALDY